MAICYEFEVICGSETCQTRWNEKSFHVIRWSPGLRGPRHSNAAVSGDLKNWRRLQRRHHRPSTPLLYPAGCGKLLAFCSFRVSTFCENGVSLWLFPPCPWELRGRWVLAFAQFVSDQHLSDWRGFQKICFASGASGAQSRFEESGCRPGVAGQWSLAMLGKWWSTESTVLYEDRAVCWWRSAVMRATNLITALRWVGSSGFSRDWPQKAKALFSVISNHSFSL